MRVVLGAIVLTILAMTDAAAGGRRPICPDARYVVDAPDLVDGAGGRLFVRVEDDRGWFETFCSGSGSGRIRRTPRGPRLKARLRGCAALGRDVKVVATFADGCSALEGAIRTAGTRPRRRDFRAVPSRCGDDVLDRSGGESCDGSADGCLEGTACTDQCTCVPLPTTTSTTSTTIPVCGDGVRGGSEACDGADRGDQSCQSAGFDDGTLGCTDDCQLDTSACCVCGNNVIEAACGETCDGTAIGAGACSHGGPISCLSSCLGWSFNACFSCGNGVREGSEQCDGQDLGGATCPEASTGGAPVCDHCFLDDGPCRVCGDGEIDAGEFCDDGNLESGDGCSSTCGSECGNGSLAGSEACDDGNLVAGDGCSEFCSVEDGFSGGGDENAEYCALIWGAARTSPETLTPVRCQDGATPCDRSPASDGACRFLAYFCVNNPGYSGPCTWGGPARVELLAGGEHALDASAQETVLDAFEQMLGRGDGVTVERDGLVLEVSPPVQDDLCGQFLLDVPAGETRRVPIQISDGGDPAAVDVDAVDFVCDE